MCNGERTLWMMNLLRDEKSNFEFCKERGIVGFGWGLRENTTTDYEEFKNLTKLEGHYYKNGVFDSNLDKALKCFDKMTQGDLILLRDDNMQFYVCVVLDDEKCINQGALYFEANATCNRKVRFLPIVIDEKEFKDMGLENDDYVLRGTIKELSSSPAEEKIEKFIKEVSLPYLS